MAKCIYKEYTDPVEELPYESREGGYQGTVLDTRELLEHLEFEVDSDELFDAVADSFEDHGWCRRDYFALTPKERMLSGWDRFKRAMRHERRFTFWSMGDNDSEEYHPDYLPVGKMLAEIGEDAIAANLLKPLPKETRLWRVRLHETGSAFNHDHELSPPPDKAKQPNRMGPSGVPMFYGAQDFETACVETVGPGRDGKSVTGVAFVTLRDRQILDLFEIPFLPSFFDLDRHELRDALSFLHSFARDLAQPIDRDRNEHVEYVPTQAFTEYVRFEKVTKGRKPIDDIRYKSSRNGRACYVLFCGQDECVEDVEWRRGERWMLMDSASLRTEEVAKLRFLVGK